jgi:CspA family cold shock protein
MTTGTVKWFNETKGYGFIELDNGSGDAFVHISAVQHSGLPGLNEGDKVGFDLKEDRMRGKSSAENLQLQ